MSKADQLITKVINDGMFPVRKFKRIDKEALEKIARSVVLLEGVVRTLKEAGESYHEQGNPHRGNIRIDARDKLDAALTNLKARTSYFAAAFKKGPE